MDDLRQAILVQLRFPEDRVRDRVTIHWEQHGTEQRLRRYERTGQQRHACGVARHEVRHSGALARVVQVEIDPAAVCHEDRVDLEGRLPHQAQRFCEHRLAEDVRGLRPSAGLD